MTYLKAAHKIEEASFSKIQEIIDQEHPDIHFSDPFEEAVLKRVVLPVQTLTTFTISSFPIRLLRKSSTSSETRARFLRIRPWSWVVLIRNCWMI